MQIGIGGDAKELNLIFERRGDASLQLEFVDQDTGLAINLSGYSFKSSLFDNYGGTNTVDFTIDSSQAAAGIIVCNISSADSNNPAKVPNKGFWDFWWTDSNNKKEKKLFGTFQCRQSLTQI